jgi:hypothetical protein
MNTELQTAMCQFIGAFEIAFRYDWEYTKDMIGDEKEGATFIEPGLEDEEEDWASRGELLEKYRRLVSIMKQQGLGPIFPEPLFTNVLKGRKRIW